MSFLRLLESARSPVLTCFFRFCTLFGEEMMILAVICCVFWCINKDLAYRIGLAFFLSGLMVQDLKIIFRTERPWVTDPSFKAVEEVLDTATGYSFPSGHTQSSVALFLSIAFFFKNVWVRILCVVLFLLAGLSRMYLGVHTPADVLISMLLTVIITAAVFRFMKFYNHSVKHNAAIASVIIVISAAVMIHSAILYGSGIIESRYVADCVKAAAAGLGFALGWFVERTYINFDERRGKIWQHALKLVCGIAVLLLIKEAFKLLPLNEFAIDSVRYFSMAAWALTVYPYILKKLSAERK